MAGEQDIVGLGIDITSFSPQKLAVLREFITAFNSLAKYDGKIFNPVMGDGLTKFNTSAAETNKLLEEVNIRLANINTNFVRFTQDAEQRWARQVTVVRNYKKTLDDTKNSSSGFNVQMGGMLVNLEGIGTRLTHILTLLRYMAFLLPGLGIAGIFNLMFQGIGKAAEGLGLYNSGLKETTILHEVFKQGLDNLAKSAENLKDKLDFTTEIDNLILKLADFAVQQQGFNKQEIKQQEDINKISDAGKIIEGEQKIQNELLETKNKAKDAAFEFIKMGAASQRFIDISLSFAKGGKIPEGLISRLDSKKEQEFLNTYNSVLDKIQESQKRQQEAEKTVGKSYIDIQIQQKEKEKIILDEERKRYVETNKDKVSVNLATQKEILSNDRKFYDEKKKAIEKTYADEVRLAQLSRISITGQSAKYGDQAEAINLSATPGQVDIALNRQATDIEKAKIARDKAIEKLDIEFYQRKLKALTDINKDELELDAKKNLDISKNNEKSLGERLEAYAKYIRDKQAIADFDYAKDIQRSADKAGGLTSLIPEEKRSIDVKNATEKASIVADAERQVYDIVYSSLTKQIRDTQDAIKVEADLSKIGYTEALHRLNELYDNKKISLRKYQEEKKRIDFQYQREELDEQIRKDQADLTQLQRTALNKIGIELDLRQKLLEIAKQGGNQDEINRAQGAVSAAEKATTDVNIAIKVAKDKLNNDKLRREQISPSEDKDRNKWIDQAVRVEEKLNAEIVKIYDERIAHEEALVERRKQLFDQQVQDEQNAIEKSSLNQKDKIAFEIQLQAQKEQADLKAQRDEHELRVKEFEFNKKLALANAAVGIAAAIIKDGLTTPKSIADAAIGAIEVFAILAAQPPSFGEGIDYLPRTMKARFGEAGPEEIRIPGRKPFVAMSETISVLPKGTQIIPLRKEHPEFGINREDESWAQTKFLANQIKKSNKEIKNVFRPTIIVDMNYESRKRQILGN